MTWKRNLPTFATSILPILLFPVDVEDKSLYEKYICRVRIAHQPLKAPEGIKRVNSEGDRDPIEIFNVNRMRHVQSPALQRIKRVDSECDRDPSNEWIASAIVDPVQCGVLLDSAPLFLSE